MEALVGIYLTFVIVAFVCTLFYIWIVVPYWMGMGEEDLERLLRLETHRGLDLRKSREIAKAELEPLKTRREEIVWQRYNRGEMRPSWRR